MKRHALFVGVDEYADGHIPNLSCAVSDATDLHGFFKYGAGYDRVELLPNPAGKKEVLGMVRELTSDLRSGDFFLFFFAGHGFRVGENHVLVCAKDLYEDVKYEDDGLPLGQLKRRLSGSFDSALLLDACQSDILATRGGEGIAERDLSLILDSPAERPGCGALTVVTSCDAGQTAAELSEGRHGLFTMAMLDLLNEAQGARARLDLSDAFRMCLGRRMGEIAARSGISTGQRPRFSCTGDSCFVLLDGIASAPAIQATAPLAAQSRPVAPPKADESDGEGTEAGATILEKSTKLRGVMQFDSGYLSKYFITDPKPMECVMENPFILIFEGGISDVQAMRSFMTEFEKIGHPLLVVAEDVGDEVLKMLVEKRLRGACCVCAVKVPGDCRTELLEDMAVVTGCRFFSKDLNIRLQDIQIEWLGRAKEIVVAKDGTIVIGGRGTPGSIKERVETIKWQIDEAVSGDGRDRLRERLARLSCEEYGKAQRLYIQGEKCYRGQNFAKAFEFFQRSAKKGESEASCSLGRMFENGEGVARNGEKAMFWYRRAAELGCERAGGFLRSLEEEEFKRLEGRASRGDAQAQYDLGEKLYNGEWNVARDYAKAAKWYREAAERGHADAQYKLGSMYDCGKGVDEDAEKAEMWYRKAMENGQDDAKDSLVEMYYNLGELYYNGDGVDEDHAAALTWYLKAAVLGDEGAREALQQLLSEMFESEDDADAAEEWCAKILEEGDEDEVEIVETIKSEIEEEDSTEEEADVLGAEDNETCMETGICRTLALPGGAKMEMVYCSPGEFTMGSSATEEDRDEIQHRVRLTRGFWLGKYPVTQAQWKSVMGDNPSYFKGDNLPVENVSWNDFQKFVHEINACLGCGARLPTEAEWEYACRAGTTGDYGSKDRLDDMGWYKNNSGDETHPVGQKKPNAWGLYDMHGNVCEWCNDWFGDYPSGSVTDPIGAESGDHRVLRGGCYWSDAEECRSAYRGNMEGPEFGDPAYGFRLCCSVVPQDENAVVIHISAQSDDQKPTQSLYEQAAAQGHEEAVCMAKGLESASGDCDEVKSAVVLEDCGHNKIAVIAAIRAITGMGLADSVKLIESTPVAIVRDVAMSECRRIAQQLEKAGARVHYAVASSPARTLGNTLRDARLAKGYSVEQIAAKARILKEVVQELENDDFHRITTPIYGRGFVKLYAECVGLDPARLVEMFMAEYNSQKS